MVILWYLHGIYIGTIAKARRDYSLPFALEKGEKKLRAISDTQPENVLVIKSKSFLRKVMKTRVLPH